jgi:hypothetical protein
MDRLTPAEKQYLQAMVYSPAHGDTAFTVPLFDEFLSPRPSQREPLGASPRCAYITSSHLGSGRGSRRKLRLIGCQHK